ncbi:hypothetical protein [Roseicella sp. DB1501]|uniref:hypothetical protein n=1 Tax=Roseicella sp. DB1501 TaxID=2730925 RepID=UPI0014929BC3|nr:hypothetical protein [Roseicella sp. DB1501]NOG70445.1 hypothetical protein [Roseicella sp. DB1501]
MTIQQAAEALHQTCIGAGEVYASVKANINASQDRDIAEMRIATCHHFPPIPDRRYDWSACYEGTEESGPFGWGPTKYQAVLDLINNHDRPGN